MTTIPVTILDDFFDNPDAVRKWALTLDYSSDSNGRWPGKRSKSLDLIHPPFYSYLCHKLLSLFFENSFSLNYEVDMAFQLIEDQPGKGWIHQDQGIFTFIIYLYKSSSQIDCGTTLWSLNSDLINPINSKQDFEISYKRLDHHLNKNSHSKSQNKHFQNYTKELSVPDKYNRLLAFSSEMFHSASNFNSDLSSRLTLVGFVKNVTNCKLPIIRSKQTLMP